MRSARRVQVAAGILLLWLAGLGVLARRELFRDPETRRAEAALRVAPSATYFALHDERGHVGFAAITVDTTERAIRIVDLVVSDVEAPEGVRRLSTRSETFLTRGLRLTSFQILQEDVGGAGTLRIRGRVQDDTLLVVTSTRGGSAAESRSSMPFNSLALPEDIVPLVVALGSRPAVGNRYTLPVIRPGTVDQVEAHYRIVAESLFVIADSASFDSASGRWVPALMDSVRAWHIVSNDTATFSRWFDGRGQLVHASALPGGSRHRTAYELAFQNWRLESQHSGSSYAPDDPGAPPQRDAVVSSARSRSSNPR